MPRVWLKRKDAAFEIYIKDDAWKLIGTIAENHALYYCKQKDSCTVEQNGIVEQILCEWDAWMCSVYKAKS